MVALAFILLVLVAVLVVAIVVSNPETYQLSIFGAIIPANSAGIFLTGAVAMAVTILAVLLLRVGIRRARDRRNKLKALEASEGPTTSASTTSPETSTTTPGTPTTPPGTPTTTPAETTPAERQAMLEEADALTRKEEPQK